MKQTRYLIVGGSAAGMAAAEKISQLDTSARIQVLSEEVDAPYFRPMIPFIISQKKSAEQIGLLGQGPYRSSGIEVSLHTRALRIDQDTCTVITTDKTSFGYDKLLIATGSRPYIPSSIKGTDAPGVFALRTLDDSRRAAERAAVTEEAVMLGGGLLNLKAAFALLERKIRVTLVVHSLEILSQLMEPQDAYLLRNALDDAGLNIITGTSATEIIADEKGVIGLLLDNGQELGCQLVCIGKGVQPNIEWLENSDIQVQQGVIVNQYTQTNNDRIHAAGDVAVTFDPITQGPVITGLWTNAVEMGKCAGANMAGKPTVYGGTFGILNATQIADMPFVSMGIVHTTGSEFEVVTKATASSYRKLVFSPDGERLVGAIFIGDIEKSGLYRSVIRDRTPVKGFRNHLVEGSLHYGHFL